ncbi:RICIN domain-containing protein [Streptomyces sp. VNUA24]|uniref:RICIN domain-containing protein n=1 Tax=Streptomyces sp. VNUA24 TaxID=3031131 RepID=UPI0023B77D21|nr:RICIN domain-containing protein [Streptomyces sp. VNUA24]WEH12989.1 RICIN domain-containing protein [Streptomyces sp. VNUA24]
MRPARLITGLVQVLLMASAVVLPTQAAQAAQPTPDTTFYVDPSGGSDSNPGTRESKPFKTIQRARAAVRAVNSHMSGDITVYLRGGTYQLSKPVRFAAQDSGTDGHTVIWKAYGSETPVVTSARTVTGWTPAGNGQYKAEIGKLDFRQLYVNGVRATRSRYPDVGSNFQLHSSDKQKQVLRVLSSQVANWKQLNHVEMVLQLQWAENHLRLKSFKNDNGVASVSLQDHEAGILFKRPYPLLSDGSPLHFENAREFITEPGEFYLDGKARILYYLPREGENMSTATVQVPTLETLFDIQGKSLDSPVHNIRFSGITFAQTNWTEASRNGLLNAQGGNYNISADTSNNQYVDRPPAGVQASNADRLSFTGNTFTQMGSTALDLHHGVHDSTVTGNTITDVAGNGITLGKFSDPTVEYHTVYNPPTSPAGEDAREVVKGITVTNNLINRTGQDYLGTAGINAGFVNSTTIDHNDISDSPWAGISLGWGWQSAANALGDNSVSRNRIGNVVNQLCDTAGIYHLSNDPGTVINENYIHDVVRTPTACPGSAVSGIYLDEGSNNLTVANNVLSRTDGFIQRNANGSKVTISGNTTTGTSVIKASGLEPAYQGLLTKTDLAYGKSTTSSSNYSSSWTANRANDNDPATGWSPTSGDTSAWWQVDLGKAYAIGQFSLTTRQDIDQPATRANFEIRGSNDPAFADYTVLGRQDDSTLPYTATLTAKVDVRKKFRYIRVAKTDGGYFFIGDLSVQQAGGAQDDSAAVPTFDPSRSYTIKNVNSGLLAEVYNSSTSDGGTVDQWAGNSGTNQQWNIVRVSGNLFKIVNRNSGKVLDVYFKSHNKGASLVQWTYNAGNNQLWYFEPSGDGYVIRNFETKQAIEVYNNSTSNGAALDQWMALNQTNQLWTIQ